MIGRLPSRLFFVADSGQAPEGLPALVARAAAAGVDFIELRRKDPLGTEARVAEARACLAAAPDATILVNDRVDVALAAGAQGAHVGQDDMPVADARALLGHARLLGLSTHDERQFAQGQSLPVDYLALGPIFSSRTKSGHADAVGLETLERCCASTELPVVAIGGLTPERARQALRAGASAVAVASALALGELEENVAAFQAACALPQRVWALCGLPASGKSRVGKELARRSGRSYVDLDESVEERAGLSVAEIFGREGESGFRRRELEALESLLAEDEAWVLALGGGTQTQRACRELLETSGARVAWLDASPETCARRLEGLDGTRPLLEGRRGPELEAALRELLEARRELHAAAELRLDAEAGVVEVVDRLLGAWTGAGEGA